jgi:hypothetical protein
MATAGPNKFWNLDGKRFTDHMTQRRFLKAITRTTQGNQTHRISQIRFSPRTNSAHMHIQSLGIAIKVSAPHPLQQLRTSQHPPGVGQETPR